MPDTHHPDLVSRFFKRSSVPWLKLKSIRAVICAVRGRRLAEALFRRKSPVELINKTGITVIEPHARKEGSPDRVLLQLLDNGKICGADLLRAIARANGITSFAIIHK